MDGFRQKLEQLSQNLKDYDAMIDSFLSGNEELSAGIDEANSSVSKVEDKIDSAVNSLNGTKTQLDSMDTTLIFSERLSIWANMALAAVSRNVSLILDFNVLTAVSVIFVEWHFSSHSHNM